MCVTNTLHLNWFPTMLSHCMASDIISIKYTQKLLLAGRLANVLIVSFPVKVISVVEQNNC